MGGHDHGIKDNKGRAAVIRRTFTGLLALALVASPVAAQGLGSKGEEFLAALRVSDGSKASRLVDESGFTVINYKGLDGTTALHIVTRKRNSNWVGYLIENGADVNATDRQGDTPLIIASRLGFGEAVARLLVKRALIDKNNRLGETALIAAVQQRHAAIVSTLLKLGADPDKRDHVGYSAREYAKRDTRSKEMLTLIETVKSRASQIKPAS